MMRIVDLQASDSEYIRQAAWLLVEGFQELSPAAWPDLASGLKEVNESLQTGRISCIALDGEDSVSGWVGGIRQYQGNVWELHPLVVRRDSRERGIGRALVAALEERVRLRGGLTVWLGTDDEINATSLSSADLYTNTWCQIKKIRNLRNHPYEFYQKIGFTIVGVMPDANGIGKPDIFMAKKIR